MNPVTAHVLVFDSGVGGMSIVGHIQQILPQVSIDYLADNQYFPYGLLSDQELIKRVIALITHANQQLQPDLIVIACNSASTLALPGLREIISTPIVGVVPAIKPAVQLSDSRVIGLLATPGTIKRDYTDDLINEFAPNCEVIRVGSARLVEVVEQEITGAPLPNTTYAEIVRPFVEAPSFQHMDTIVLACTHFPLVRERLMPALPHLTHWVDSGPAIARRVAYLLEQRKHNSLARNNTAWFTGASPASSARFMGFFQQYGFQAFETFSE